MNPGVHSGSESFSMPPCKEVRSDNIATGPGVSSFDEGATWTPKYILPCLKHAVRSLTHIEQETYSLCKEEKMLFDYNLSHITSRCFLAAAVSNSISGSARSLRLTF